MTVYNLSGGRMMEVLTAKPWLQFYSGNYLDGTMKGNGGVFYGVRSALFLKRQRYPNSLNEKRSLPLRWNRENITSRR